MCTILGKKIRAHRKLKGYSLEKLGELTDTSKSYIWEIENRASSNPTADKLAKFALALDINIDCLMNDSLILSEENKKKLLYNKFNKLSESNQNKIMQLIEIWIKE